MNCGLASILDCTPTAKRTNGYSELPVVESREGSQEKEMLLCFLTQKLLAGISEVRAIGYMDL